MKPSSEYPPKVAQAVNALRAFGGWLAAGFPVTPHAERKRRLDICEACPEFDSDARRCRACGCFGDVKPYLATSWCPRDKWPEPDEGDIGASS